jgi:hypothetical protein
VIGLSFFNPPVVEGESWRTRWAVSGILDESSGLRVRAVATDSE